MALSLVAAGLFTGPPARAAAAPKAKPGRSLAAIDSPAAPRPQSEIPQPGDFSNPPRPGQPSAPRAPFDPARATPLDAETTPTGRSYRNPDGTRTDVVSARPVRFQDGEGAWRDVDTTVVPGPNGTLVARAAPQAATLNPGGGDGTVASVSTAAGVFGLRHPDAVRLPAAGVDRDRATFKGALAGRDLSLALTADGFKESVTLPSAASAGSYVEEFVLPPGVTARGVPAGVEFVDGEANVVATYGDGMAFDASFPHTNPAAIGPVSVRLVSATPGATALPGVATVEVSVDPAWLADPALTFPVTIDPIFSQTTAHPTARDTMIYSGAWANTSFGTNPYLYTGLFSGAVGRSMLRFDLSTIPVDPTWTVVNASMSIYNLGYGSSCVPKRTNLLGRVAPFANTTTWNTRGTDASQVSTFMDSMRSSLSGTACYGGAWESYDARALTESWLRGSVVNNGMELRAANEADTSAFKIYSSGDSAFAPSLTVTYDHLPTMATPVAPADTSVISTATPTLTVNPSTDADGDTVYYWFRAVTAADAETGFKAVDSGWVTTTSYTVPAGALADGVTYTWHVWTYDGIAFGAPDWVWSFQLDLRLGDKGPFPRDAVGPTQVNLVNGNLVVRAASPAFPTADGPMGVSYVHNSQAPARPG